MREAKCACGDLSVAVEGEPMLVSACCCTRCQRRTGSFFGVTAYFEPAKVGHAGEPKTFRRPGAEPTVHFCGQCGTSLWWAPDDPAEGWIGVAGGCFADPTLPARIG